jgi:hypothetical protein
MADRIYGLDRGDTEFSVAEGSSTPTKDVEVVVDLAVNLEKSEVLQLLDMIKNHIVKGNWPPA